MLWLPKLQKYLQGSLNNGVLTVKLSDKSNCHHRRGLMFQTAQCQISRLRKSQDKEFQE